MAEEGATTTTTTDANVQTGFSPIVAFCFTLNVVVGTGFLTIPYAFVSGGVIASSLLLLLLSFFLDMTKDYYLEASAYAEVMLDTHFHWIRKSSNNPEQTEESGLLSEGSVAAATAASKKELYSASVYDDEPTTVANDDETYLMKDRRFEINTLCKAFLGPYGYYIYTIAYCAFAYGALWAYTSVFASALSDEIIVSTNESVNYALFVGVYGLIVVPLTCLELTEQVTFQVFLTLCRFLMMFLMISTSFLCAQDIQDATMIPSSPAAMFDLSQLYITFPILVFAQIFHPAIPTLAEPIQNKALVESIFQATLACTTFLYVTNGLFLSLAFGDSIEQSANLNWENFHAGTGTVDADGNIVDAALWTQFVSKYIYFFPAVDVLSAFPLTGIVLGNVILGAVKGDHLFDDGNRWTVVQFRLAAALPPLLLAMLVSSLGTITDYTGTFAILIGFSIPSWLFLRSRKEAKEQGFAPFTGYSSYASNSIMAHLMIAFGIVAFFICLICIIVS